VLYADSQRLIQVLVNLLSNARDASPAEAKVVIEGKVIGDIAQISVTDEGSGIKKQTIDRIFEPFFTTKDPGEGTGLGLAMVYSIIEDHKGDIEIESPVNEEAQSGTRFIISLPLGLASNVSSGNTRGMEP